MGITISLQNRSGCCQVSRKRKAGNGRSERIRTSGPCLPKAVLYQAELHSDLNQIERWTEKSASAARALL